MARFSTGDRVRLLRNASATGTISGFMGATPVVDWDPDAAPGDPDFLLRGMTSAVAGTVIERVPTET